MFTANHFIWLAICVVFIAVMTICSVRFQWKFKTVAIIAASFSFLSEGCKILTHIVETTNDVGVVTSGVLSAGALPFHLCSIFIFVIFYFAFSNGNNKIKQFLINFFTCLGLVGGIMAMLIPTSGVAFNEWGAYQCFVYHAVIVWFAIYNIATKQADLKLKSYVTNMITLFYLSIIMIWVNSMLQNFNTNFFYVVRPPMKNLPYLNLNHGWIAYYFRLVLASFVLITSVHIGPVIKQLKNGKKAKPED